jgi:hypothetical protein
MLPLSDGLAARRFPVVTIALIAANLAAWILYELPDLEGAVAQASFYPCDADNSWFVIPSAEGSGVAFFAHIGGFAFVWLVARALLDTRRIHPQSTARPLALVPL